jgi:nitrite reductase (NO-forming)
MPGPDLLGVTERRSLAWLRRMLKTPDQMVVTDSIARSLAREYKTKMPNAKLSDQEVEALVQYLASRSGAPGQ